MLNIGTNRKLSKIEWFVFAVLAVAAVLSFVVLPADAQSEGKVKVYFLDVGQGDAEFIETPSGNQVLIDGGPGGKIVQELGKVMPFYDHSIDLVILTHPHVDHVSGLIEVLKRYKVDKIIENHVPYATAEYAEWNKFKSGSQVTQARAGQVVDLGDGIRLAVLYPFDSGAGDAPITQIAKNVHDYMVITRLDYGQDGILFTGDAEAKVEDRLIAAGASLSARFLKVGHHGSKTSTTERFLEAVNPEAAFIEVGAKNRYGHPHPLTIQKLENRDIKYYRTDVDGTIELILDGQNYFVKTGR